MSTKIKIFKENNDIVINYFLKESKGVIVSYNPIIVQYDDKNTVLDPYRNLEAITINAKVSYIKLRDFYTNDQGFRSHKLELTSEVDTILFPLNHNASMLRFMKEGKVLFENSRDYYFSINMERYNYDLVNSHVVNRMEGRNPSYKLEFNDHYDADAGSGHDFALYSMLIEAGEKKLNYNF